MKQYKFHRLESTLILELVTGQLSHYAPLSHFATRYATIDVSGSIFFKSVIKALNLDSLMAIYGTKNSRMDQLKFMENSL